MRIRACIVAAVLQAMCVSATLAAEDDPFIGAWTLDARSSRYEAGDVPQAMRIVMEVQETGVHYRSETHFSSGRTTTAEYTADYQEHLTPVTGDHGLLLPVTVKRLDAHRQLVSYISGLRVVATSTRTVSSDGRHLTIKTTSTDTQGRQRLNVGLYVKDRVETRP